jgi:methionine-rich copper-binding protein CopC
MFMNRRIVAGLIVALALSIALFNVASAHAKLVSSDPAAGAKLTTAPTKVKLVFSEEISDKATDSFFNVTDESGAMVGTGKLDTTDLDHETLSGDLKAGLGDGVYTVKWQTITPDDNGKSEGTFSFGVNKDPGPQPTAAPEPTEAPEPTAAPTAAPAAGAAAPTAVPAGGQKPTTLPTTSEDESNLSIYLLLGAAVLVAAGLALRQVRGRTR